MRILVAEDDSYAATMYKAALESNGHEVNLTYDGQECLRRYHGGTYEVVILDYRLPALDGLKVARQILFANPKQRIIFLSAYAAEAVAEALEDLGELIQILPKPFESAALVELVEEIT